MSNPPPDDPADDDLDSFRRAMADVKPLDAPARVERPAAKITPRARFADADELAALEASRKANPEQDMLDLETGEELAYMRPGIQHSVLRKLRRGQLSVAAELDLHGLTAKAAGGEIRSFIREARAEGARCVRIIHGKGKRSGHRGPVLKEKTASVLRKMDEVLAFGTAARAQDGGSGAVFVLLRNR
ncbi:MAG: Smr/MutS family protein [Gammaproteobacteria bacterium]|nr:Smr/MutS family protein [Gammaproteobacteria bacterium]